MSTRNDTPDSASVPTRLVNISAPGKRSSVEREWAQKWLTTLASDFSVRFTSDMDNTTDGTWDSLPVRLNEKILETLAELKFTHTTPVQVTCTPQPASQQLFSQHSTSPVICSPQAACIPLFMSNKDVAAEAVSVRFNRSNKVFK